MAGMGGNHYHPGRLQAPGGYTNLGRRGENEHTNQEHRI